MTRYARAQGSKSCNARVTSDPTPWSEMVSPNKRMADNVEGLDVTTPKKDRTLLTPAKKTPKIVKLQPGTPKSPAASTNSTQLASPLVATPSTKKAAKKTPAKQKGLDAVNTPRGGNTPQGNVG